MDKLGCFFLSARSLGDLRDRIAHAESLGYEVAGLPNIAGRDALATLAAVAPSTERIGLATGIVPVWTRTPVAMAQEAAVVHEATDGRFMLGIGVGHQMLIESWHGTAFREPLAAMRDYLTILRKLFRDGGVEYDGEVFSAHFGFMGYRPSPDIKILVAALGPRMLRLAGELADGVVLWTSSPRHVRETVIPNLTEGARAAGRDPSELSVLPCMFAAPGPDRAAARDAVRRQLFPYLGLPFYRNMLVASGFGEDLERFDAGLAAQDLPLALAGVSDAMVDELAATGSNQEIAETIARFVDAGATLPGVGVASGYEGYEGTKRSLELLREAAVAA